RDPLGGCRRETAGGARQRAGGGHGDERHAHLRPPGGGRRDGRAVPGCAEATDRRPDHDDRLRGAGMSIYDFSAETLDGNPASLSDWRDKVVLIVNTASKCGFTPQYAGLEALYRKYRDRGFVVLGFPCNQFGAQEPGDAAEIANFCSLTYDVDFPMMRKIDVNGPGTHPLYAYLKT